MVNQREMVNQLTKMVNQKLRVGPKRERPDLRKLTTCPRCGTKLAWCHMMKRHRGTRKCKGFKGKS